MNLLNIYLNVEKLALIFPKCRSKRKYGCVGFDYGSMIEQDDNDDDDEQEEEEEEQESVSDMELKTGQGHEILSEQDKTALDKLNKQKVTTFAYPFE